VSNFYLNEQVKVQLLAI